MCAVCCLKLEGEIQKYTKFNTNFSSFETDCKGRTPTGLTVMQQTLHNVCAECCKKLEGKFLKCTYIYFKLSEFWNGLYREHISEKSGTPTYLKLMQHTLYIKCVRCVA